MTKLTPANLRAPLLRALGTLSGLKVGEAVASGQVIALALSYVGVVVDNLVGDDRVKTLGNVHAGFNQQLHQRGLASKPSRGQWALTTAGVDAARPLVTAAVDVDEDTTGDDLLDQLFTEPLGQVDEPQAPAVAVAAPEPVAPAKPVSPWADDTAGVCFDLGSLVDSYSPDSYIRMLAISQTQCFGRHDVTSLVCQSCPLAGACRAKVYSNLSSVAAELRKKDAEEAARRAATLPRVSTPAQSAVHQDESIDDILNELEAAKSPPPSRPASPPASSANADNGTELPVLVESICYRCSQIIPEKSIAVFVNNAGLRHKVCP